MKKKSIPMCVFLSCITLGIYAIVWWYSITKDVIEEANYESIDSAGLNLLYLILGSIVYISWWNYKISTYLNTIERKNNIEPDFWAPIMSMCFGVLLHQSRINRISATQKVLN